MSDAYLNLQYQGRPNYLWSIDEGAVWYVIAPCEDEALLLVLKHAGMGEGVKDVLERWGNDGIPDAIKMTKRTAKIKTVRDDDDGVTRTMFDDFNLNPATRLVACSEW